MKVTNANVDRLLTAVNALQKALQAYRALARKPSAKARAKVDRKAANYEAHRQATRTTGGQP